MNINKNYHEKLLILFLFVSTLFFIFWIIPKSIIDPEGFGLRDGLPPSFSAYLVGLFCLTTLISAYIKINLTNKNNPLNKNIISFSSNIFFRSSKIIIICLLYSFLFIEYLGFYIGSLIFLYILTFLLGEKRIFVSILFPILLMVCVYLGFNVGFNIFLPEGKLTILLLESF